jgi:NADH dehydrogenase FAD-containing subunit
VTRLSPESAVLDDGSEVPFDYAVLATGSAIRGFEELKVSTRQSIGEREAYWRSEGQRLRQAASVVIVGGGPIGVELAGEIREAFPEKSVTLIEQQAHLLPALGERAGAKAQRVLARLGVKVLTSQQAEVRGNQVMLGSGTTLVADLVYRSLGVLAQSDYLDTHYRAAVNQHNQAMVDQYLRLKGSANIFAVGDVTDTPEIKLGAFAVSHAKLTVRNIRASLTTRELKPYRPMRGPMGIVVLGRRAGIVKLGPLRMDFMIGAKQKDMLTSTYLKPTKRAVVADSQMSVS